MAEEKRRRTDSTASGSSGAFEVRRRRVSGVFDVAGAHRALELLADNSLYGSIVISDGLVDCCFFFTRGGLRVITAGRKLPSLVERLRQRGAISPDDARKVEAALQKERSEAKGKVLLEEREALIEVARQKPADVDEVAREVIAEAFLDGLFWENAQFEAQTGEPNQEIMQRRDLSAVTLSLGVADLVEKLQGKIRAVSEVRRTVSSLRVTVVPTPKGKEAVEKREKLGEGPVGERRTKLMHQVGREAGIRAPELATRLKCGELELASLLHELTVQGYVKLDRPPPDKKEELERIRKMEEAIDQALSQLLRRVRLAEESAAVGETGKAARHMARAGGLLLQEGRDDEAARTFGTALKHSQEDLEAREGFVQSLWNTGRTAEALDQSDELGRRYLALNLPARAKKILERALGREERTGTLDLLVSTLVKLKMSKAATEAGERLVNRLRREGKRDEARTAAARLLEIADDEDRARILRAAGQDRRRAVVLVASLVVIGMLMAPVQSARANREGYATAAREAQAELQKKQPLDKLAAVLIVQEKRFEELAALGGEPGQKAGDVRERLIALREDVQLCLTKLSGEALPWRVAEDLELAQRRIKEVRRELKTEPMRGALDRAITEIDAFVAEAEAAQSRLDTLPPGPEAVAEARRMLATYPGLPHLLRETSLRIQVTSRPPGAKVKWEGLAYSQPTPLSLALPLVGKRSLVLELDGYLSRESVVELATLAESGLVDLLLDPAPPPKPVEREPVVQRPPDPPPVTPGPPKPPPPPPPPPAAPPPRIETRDEVTGAPPTLVFESSARYFADLRLARTFQAVVFVLNEVEGFSGWVHVVGLRVHLVVRTPQGWVMERQGVSRRFDKLRRPVQVRPDGTRVVAPLESTLAMDPKELRKEAQAALDEAVKQNQFERENR